MSGWRTLTESSAYSSQYSKLGNVKRLDEALIGITWGISSAPEEFPIVSGRVRLAKTRPMMGSNGKRVVFRIWFIEIDSKEIELVAIHAEEIP